MQRIEAKHATVPVARPQHRQVRSVIEERSPVEALTVYRALVVCHMAGAVFALMGATMNGGAIDARFHTATVVVAGVQFAVATWLLLHPEWVPRLLLGTPRTTWLFSLAMAVFFMVPATDPVSPPTVTVAFAWISTAAAVGPPRAWRQLGLAATGLIGLSWMVAGIAAPEKPLWEASLLSMIAMAPGALNGAWMGATGNAVARKVRRWGLVIGQEDGALASLAEDAQRVRVAADRVLDAASRASIGSVDEIALRTLRESANALEDEMPTVAEALTRRFSGMRTAFTIEVTGDDARIEPQVQAVVNDAVHRQLSNVDRHAPSARHVTVEATSTGAGRVSIAVSDDGAGTAPRAEDEGEGTGISRSTLAACHGTLRYEQGHQGVRLVLEVPASVEAEEVGQLGLVRELRQFIDACLRNNRVVGYITPIPFLLWGMDAPLWSAPLLLCGGAVIELAFSHAGPSDQSRKAPLVAGASVAIVVTLCFGLGLDGDQSFVCSAATAYPIIELAWRGHWRLWWLFEALRGLAIMPWLMEAGIVGFGGAFGLPTALTLIAVGARRLMIRATAVEERVGGIVARRRTALEVAQRASLRHDVVNRLAGTTVSDEVREALDELDIATNRLGDRHVRGFRPLEDLIDGVAAACAPVPVVVADTRPTADDELGTDPSLEGSLGLERRLATLELAAGIGESLVDLVAPRWDGAARLREVVAEVQRTPEGALRVTLRVVADASGGALATPVIEGLTELGVPGTELESLPGGLAVTIEPTWSPSLV